MHECTKAPMTVNVFVYGSCRVKQFAQDSLKRVRLTGGKSLARPASIEMIARIVSISVVKPMSLIANLMLLERLAQRLASAVLKQVHYEIVAVEQGHHPHLQLNTVVVNGLNTDDVSALAQVGG